MKRNCDFCDKKTGKLRTVRILLLTGNPFHRKKAYNLKACKPCIRKFNNRSSYQGR